MSQLAIFCRLAGGLVCISKPVSELLKSSNIIITIHWWEGSNGAELLTFLRRCLIMTLQEYIITLINLIILKISLCSVKSVLSVTLAFTHLQQSFYYILKQRPCTLPVMFIIAVMHHGPSSTCDHTTVLVFTSPRWMGWLYDLDNRKAEVWSETSRGRFLLL